MCSTSTSKNICTLTIDIPDDYLINSATFCTLILQKNGYKTVR